MQSEFGKEANHCTLVLCQMYFSPHKYYTVLYLYIPTQRYCLSCFSSPLQHLLAALLLSCSDCSANVLFIILEGKNGAHNSAFHNFASFWEVIVYLHETSHNISKQSGRENGLCAWGNSRVHKICSVIGFSLKIINIFPSYRKLGISYTKGAQRSISMCFLTYNSQRPLPLAVLLQH